MKPAAARASVLLLCASWSCTSAPPDEAPDSGNAPVTADSSSSAVAVSESSSSRTSSTGATSDARSSSLGQVTSAAPSSAAATSASAAATSALSTAGTSAATSLEAASSLATPASSSGAADTSAPDAPSSMVTASSSAQDVSSAASSAGHASSAAPVSSSALFVSSSRAPDGNCVTQADCTAGQTCECADDTCTVQRCGSVACPCGFNAGMDSTCDGPLVQGVEDVQLTCGGFGCASGGGCVLEQGMMCLPGDFCSVGPCNCADELCTQRVCAPQACFCGWDALGDGGCDAAFARGADPAGHCMGSACDGMFGCLRSAGEACTSNNACFSGRCGCADTACQARVCTDSACNCQFNSNGAGACEGPLSSGVDDAHNSCGSTACNGQGACLLLFSQQCLSDAQCESGICGCGNAACSFRRCDTVRCDCSFNHDADGTCDDGNISYGRDPNNACPGALFCNGQGECQRPLGDACTANDQCVSGFCTCEDETCSARACAATSCGCRFNADHDSTCEGVLVRGTPASSCTFNGLCDGRGDCQLANGAQCSWPESCASGYCEMAGTFSSTRLCSAVPCPCQYNSNGDGTCDGNQVANTDPLDVCPGTNSCNGLGACKTENGGACMAGSECSSGQCVCANADCSARMCSAVPCQCSFNSNGDGTCDGFVESHLDDAANTCGARSCDGAGGCTLSLGFSCMADDQCENRHCECGNGECTYKLCAPADCGCMTATISGCGTEAIWGDRDPDNFCAGSLTCNGSGQCRRVDGTVCSFDYQCGTNRCECSDANCVSKTCGSGCACTYDSSMPDDGVCETPLNVGVDNPAHPACAGLGCNAAGACRVAQGSCTVDSDCVGNRCECADATCSTKACSATPCFCQFNTNGDNTCDGFVQDGLDDARNNCGVRTCAGNGTCNLANNVACSSNSQCESNHCECTNADCSGGGRCSPQDCPCTFNNNGDATCEGNVLAGRDDRDNTCGATACNGSGACQ